MRVIYSVLSAFSPNIVFSSSSSAPTSPAPNALSKFNTVAGSWEIYLVMGLIMELIVVVIYCATGMLLPLGKEDYGRAGLDGARMSEEHHQLYEPQHSAYVPEQSEYAPPQPGYASQESAYAPPQSGYSPSPLGFAPPQSGFPPTARD